MPFLLTGCFLSSLRGCVDPDSGDGMINAEFSSDPCFMETLPGGTTFVSCPIQLPGTDVMSASYEILSPAEVLSLLFLDPVVVQFPDNASNFGGSFTSTNPPAMGSLVVSTVECIDTQPGEQLCAEPVHQLVIFEFPAGSESGQFSVEMAFTVDPPAAVQVKPILTGKVTVAGQTFFPVLFPCITDFASAPAVTVPLGLMPVDITLPTNGLSPCQGSLDFGSAVEVAPAPALGAAALGALAAALGLAGLIAVQRRGSRRSAGPH